MPGRRPAPEALTYFTHEVDGRLYGGWFRRLPGTKVEVIARGQIKSAACDAAPEGVAIRLLEEIVRSLHAATEKSSGGH